MRVEVKISGLQFRGVNRSDWQEIAKMIQARLVGSAKVTRDGDNKSKGSKAAFIEMRRPPTIAVEVVDVADDPGDRRAFRGCSKNWQ